MIGFLECLISLRIKILLFLFYQNYGNLKGEKLELCPQKKVNLKSLKHGHPFITPTIRLLKECSKVGCRLRGGSLGNWRAKETCYGAPASLIYLAPICT